MKAVHYKNPQILGANVKIWLLRRSGVRNLCPPTLNTQRGMSRAARTLRIQIHPTASRKLGTRCNPSELFLFINELAVTWCGRVTKNYFIISFSHLEMNVDFFSLYLVSILYTCDLRLPSGLQDTAITSCYLQSIISRGDLWPSVTLKRKLKRMLLLLSRS